MCVDFVRTETTRYHSLLHRDDGVVVRFEGGSYNKIGPPHPRIPHDAAHLIVETHQGLRGGVWGTLAAGGMFAHAEVVEGRQKPHARTRGRALVKEAHPSVMEAELATRVACDALLAGSLTDPALAEALRTAAATWAGLEPGEAMTYALPSAWGAARRSRTS